MSMDSIPLEDLGLSEKWPKLAKIQADLGDFQKREQKASAEGATLRGQLPQARARDLDAEAAALLQGKKAPEPRHERAAQDDLDRAVRNRDVASRAVQSLHEKLGAFMAEHQAEVFADVVAARGEVAERLAEHARGALSEYARYEDLGYQVKRLRPAAPVVENSPAQRLTNSFAGLHTTRSDGPAPGDVAAILAYLVGLASEGEGGADAA